MKYFKFTTEQEAQNAIDNLNAILGFPKYPDSKTKTYCNFQHIEDWYGVIADEITEKYIDCEIVEPDV